MADKRVSLHGSLRGKSWSVWTEELGPGAPPGDTGRGSPMNFRDDVMKLPKEDLKTFGKCPAWDNFVLVNCDKCDKVVKLEALEYHMTLRHGSKSERQAYHRVLAARAAAVLETGQVRLTPATSRCPSPRLEKKMDDDEQSNISTMASLNSGDLPPQIQSGSSSSLGSVEPNSPPITCQADSRPSSIHSPTPPRSPSPSPAREEMMDITDSPVVPSQPEPVLSPQQRPTPQPAFISEEADSTTNNVISIPDTEDIPNIEIGIISEGQVTDSINTKFDFSPPVIPAPSVPQRVHTVETPSLNPLTQSQPSARPVVSSPVTISSPTPQISRVLPQQIEQPMEVDPAPVPQAPTHYITVSPLSKSSPSPKKLVVGRMGHVLNNSQVVSSPQVLNSSGQILKSGQIFTGGQIIGGQVLSSGQIISTTQPVSNNPILGGSQFITVASGHTLSGPPQVSKATLVNSPHVFASNQQSVPTPHIHIPEKKLTGREREYDPNKHCGVWDADAKRNCTRSLTCKSHSVYLKRKVVNRSGPFDELLAQHKADKEAAIAKQAEAGNDIKPSILEQRLKLVCPPNIRQEPVKSGVQLLQPNHVKIVNKDVYCEDTLHYTTDHPKPLAVCTFGGKRVGGLFITDRSRLLTRKIVRVALANSPLQAVKTVPIARQQAMPYIVNFQSGGGQARLGTIKLASSQPQQIIVQDPFKTDIQDFKGGIKFELGRKIQQILPSGSEGAG